MSLQQLLSTWRGDPRFMENVAAWRTLPAQPAHLAPIPPALDARLTARLAARGVHALYTHQAQTVELALAGHHVAVVTPTASGKTLCYNLPVFHTLLNDPSARALYLFPTKALAQDQLAELGRLASADPAVAEDRIVVSTYDGDTPSAQRTQIRKTARILLSNPDMLHVGILPFHTQWAALLSGLRWIVIDEMHMYRGVFGSHVANVLRRLLRLCAYYGSEPQFICTSATIANPQQLAARLTERPITLVDDNGAPRGEKQVILVNPPLVDAEKGIRRSPTLQASDLAAVCLEQRLQTIVFGRSRLTTELLLTYLREKRTQRHEWETADSTPATAIRGYRGGYLPNERRAIEAGLRSGAVQAVVATNALELGIDIGRLQAAVICGYPGSIASTWQQIGRAGRTTEGSVALLIATGGALDQYLIQHPEFLFERSPEHALINPDNLMLLLDQVRCAAFELPFAVGEPFGQCAFIDDVLQLLTEAGDVHVHSDQYYWSGEGYPARAVSLRSAGHDAVVIQTSTNFIQTPGSTEDVDFMDLPAMPVVDDVRTVIGEVDQASALRLAHQGAIYLHEGQSYLVQHLDLAALRADVTPVLVDYYTDTMSDTEVKVLVEHAHRAVPDGEPASTAAFGDIEVTTQVTGFRRIKRHTHETLGVQPLAYPPQTLATSAYWLAVQPATQRALEAAGLWFDSINDYGPNWEKVRQAVRARDRYRCTQCGIPEARGQEHDVHHKIPFRAFGYVRGVNENHLLANRLENLVLVCRTCHQRVETAGRLRTGLDGLAYALVSLAPVHLMCDRGDLNMHVAKGEGHGPGADAPAASVEPQGEGHGPGAGGPAASVEPQLATIYIYELIPAGLGFSALLYDLHETLLEAARRQIGSCICQNGCPACVGPVLDDQPMQLATKRLTLGLLDVLLR